MEQKERERLKERESVGSGPLSSSLHEETKCQGTR